jgi:ArsR family transcriptional regulator, virulence genes transcriptional regulator
MTKQSAKQTQKLQSQAIYEMQAEICAALANPVRLQILDLLSNGEKTSSELLEELDIPKANLSQHLSVLKDAGIIHARKEGLFQYLSLAIPKIKDACSIVMSVLREKIQQEEKRHADLKKEIRAQR